VLLQNGNEAALKEQKDHYQMDVETAETVARYLGGERRHRTVHTLKLGKHNKEGE
jgi:hypothetical protein